MFSQALVNHCARFLGPGEIEALLFLILFGHFRTGDRDLRPQNPRVGFKGLSFLRFNPAGEKKNIFKGRRVCQFKIRNVSGIFMLLKLQYISAD